MMMPFLTLLFNTPPLLEPPLLVLLVLPDELFRLEKFGFKVVKLDDLLLPGCMLTLADDAFTLDVNCKLFKLLFSLLFYYIAMETKKWMRKKTKWVKYKYKKNRKQIKRSKNNGIPLNKTANIYFLSTFFRQKKTKAAQFQKLNK